MATKMHRSRDRTDVLVEDWQVEEWKGYGFHVLSDAEAQAKADHAARVADEAKADAAIDAAVQPKPAKGRKAKADAADEG